MNYKFADDKVHHETVCVVHDAVSILYKDPLNQLPGEKLNVGFTTRATLNRLLEAEDITPQEVQLFQQAALAFLVRAVEYGINKLPLKEALLKHAKFVDVQQRTECGVEDALYFVDRFQELLPFHGPEEQDKVSEEFLEYQLMDIPMPQDPTTFNVEEFWWSMSSIKSKHRGKTSIILPSISSTQRDREHEGKKENKHLAPLETHTLNSMLYPECSLTDILSDTEALALLSSHERLIRAQRWTKTTS
ncbi:uncharacterized protein LOC130561779 [Triplophysa rosa]|nr:uncharacterized protein LOC130561779 [Triplophysa rosa]